MTTPAESDSTYPAFSDIVRGFAPGWFASVMGTGALALATLGLSQTWPSLYWLACALHYANLILFVVLAVPWLARWWVDRSAALASLKHPVQASFYPTFSMAMLVIAAQFLAFDKHITLALLFWIPGAVLTFALSFAVLYHMFAGEHVGIEHVTPAMFIPAVGLAVIPAAGVPLLAHLTGLARELAWLANICGFSAGVCMYLGLLGLTLQRHYLVKPAGGALTPTVWIHLAPSGVISVGLLNLTTILPIQFGTALVISLLLWGYGLWWLIMASLLTLTARARGQLPFALSWWGFTFPLGIFVIATLRIGQHLKIEAMAAVGVLAWLLLLGLWSLTLLRTAQDVVSGEIWQAHHGQIRQ